MLETNNSQSTTKSTGYGSSCTKTCISSNRSSKQKVLLRAKASEERIMMKFIGLVISVAATYEGSGLSFDDLVQV
jgi:DNA-directed RNA polymerase sigma subunit (sigma70/sigma32)